MSPKNVAVGIAWFRPADWNRLLEISEDRNDLDDSHAKWEQQAQRTMRSLEREGYQSRKVIIDLDELIAYCAEQGVPINSSSRSKFTSQKLQQQANRPPT